LFASKWLTALMLLTIKRMVLVKTRIREMRLSARTPLRPKNCTRDERVSQIATGCHEKNELDRTFMVV